MPAIIVKDYTWRQTDEAVIISIRLVGHPKKIDLFAIDNYMKASYPPFILELFLWAKILEAESECIIGEETAVFTLKKEEMGREWPNLVIEDLDKDKKRAHRSRVFDLARINAEERAKAKSEKRQALQKQAVRAQIDLDTINLNKIEAMRDSHRREAMREFEDWRNRAERPILENISGIIQENRKAYRAPLEWFKNEKQAKTSELAINDRETIVLNSETIVIEKGNETESNENTAFANTSNITNAIIKLDKIAVSSAKEKLKKDESERLLTARKNRDSARIVDASSSSSDSSDSSSDREDSKCEERKNPNKEIDGKTLRKYYRRREKENADRGKEIVRRLLNGKNGSVMGNSGRIFDKPTASVPRPRKCGIIDVRFSEREFPTPARESHRLEEEEWLEKQAEARRKSGFISEDLSAEEQDPLWLKDKGDEFFKAGNHLGAISAYTHGIKLSDKMSSLYVNRSAAHYAAGNYRRCAEDCSTALELMIPKCESNRDSRARCHARLGAALCKLSAPQHGIPELEAALKLSPENETIKRDLLVAKRYFELRD